MTHSVRQISDDGAKAARLQRHTLASGRMLDAASTHVVIFFLSPPPTSRARAQTIVVRRSGCSATMVDRFGMIAS